MNLQASLKSLGQERVLQTGGYFVAFGMLGLVTASLGPTLPGLAENTGTTPGEIGFLFLGRAGGYMLGSMLGGWLYDRLPGNPVIAVMLLSLSALMLLVPLSSWLVILTLLLFVVGLAEGGIDVGGNALLVWSHGAAVGPFMNAGHFFFGVGAFLSPLIVAQALNLGGGIQAAYWIIAALLLPAGVWLWRLPNPIKPTESPRDAEGVTLPPATLGMLVLIVAFFALYVGAESSTGGWLTTYAVVSGLGSEATGAYLTSAFWGALTLGRLLSIPLAVRTTPRTLLLSNLLGCLLSLAVLFLWPQSLVALWVGALGLGLSMAAIFPTLISFAERRMLVTGQVAGWFLVGASMGAMTVPWLMGRAFDAFGPAAFQPILLIDLLLALLIFFLLMRRHA